MAFLRDVAATEWIFGETDCSMTVANWVKLRTGRDPGHSLRGHYRTERGWKRIAAKAGGLGPLFDRLAADAGLVSTDDPEPGDIGLVELPGFGPAGAIRVRRGWFVHMKKGVTVAPFPTLAAWRV